MLFFNLFFIVISPNTLFFPPTVQHGDPVTHTHIFFSPFCVWHFLSEMLMADPVSFQTLLRLRRTVQWELCGHQAIMWQLHADILLSDPSTHHALHCPLIAPFFPGLALTDECLPRQSKTFRSDLEGKTHMADL